MTTTTIDHPSLVSATEVQEKLAGRTVAGTVQASQISLERCTAAVVVADEDVTLSDSTGLIVVADNDLVLENGGSMVAVAGQNLQITNGGAAVIVAGQDAQVTNGGSAIMFARRDLTVTRIQAPIEAAGNRLRTEQAGSLLLAGREVYVKQGSIGIVIGGTTNSDDQTRILVNISLRSFIDAAVGLAFFVPVHLLRRLVPDK